ncbi:MAG: hypothetical protein R3B09_17625 [Nannocystaceae bacterium]
MPRIQRSALVLTSFIVHLAAAAGCNGGDGDTDGDTDGSTASTTGNATTGSPTGSPTGGSTGDPSGDPTGETSSGSDSDSDTGEPSGPHALGSIVLGESHPALGGSATPSVSAVFIPDAAEGGAAACTETLSGCTLTKIPECKGGCEADEYCGFNDSCGATCLPICDAQCKDGEVCYFPSPGTTGCKAIESFDAGALSFLGTPIPITLFPPYAFMGDNGSPFSSGGAATVQASGAAGAGYEAFERDFTGAQFIQTSPSLDKIPFADVFGSGDIPVKWVAGTGKVTITATVQSADFKFGTITCEADDASGSFAVPRAALEAAIDGEAVNGLTLSVSRRRRDLHTDLTTKGTLISQTVQPVGWLEIITSSTEFHTYEGCAPGEAICDDSCVDVQSDSDNCGECGSACPGDDYCSEGGCVGQTTCFACADDSETGACKSQANACAANSSCATFKTCFLECDTQACADACVEAATQEALDLYGALGECICTVACTSECVDNCF